MKRLVVIGAGGNSLGIVDAVLARQQDGRGEYQLAGILDDNKELKGTTLLGVPVLGPIEEISMLGDCHVINGIGSIASHSGRPSIVERVGVPRERYATVVHPRAVIGSGSYLGCGTAILAGTVVCPTARVGDHVIILQNTTVNHRVYVEDYVTMSAGVMISGAVRIERGAFIAGGASVAPHLTIGKKSVVGMGAVVIRDVLAETVVVGNPARVLKRLDDLGGGATSVSSTSADVR